MKLLLILFFTLSSLSLFAEDNALFTYVTLRTSEGDIKLKLFKRDATRSVENFVGLANGSKAYRDLSNGERVKDKPFYKDMIFHKVHPKLGIQTGCPLGNGKGWPGFTMKTEKNELLFDRPFLVSMAKIEGAAHSVGSQFFITTEEAPHLNDQYTVIGEVAAGHEIVKKISQAKHDSMMKPVKPIHLFEVVVE